MKLVVKVVLIVLFTVGTILVITAALITVQPRIGCNIYNSMLKHNVALNREPFVDKDQYFPYSIRFEESWKEIQQEAKRLLDNQDKIPSFQDVDSSQMVIQRDQKWKTFVLLAYGNVQQKNCNACPITSSLVLSNPQITTAMFSILAPRKRIPRHTGPFKGVLRYHLGLIIPKDRDNCWIRVGNRKYSWKEGQGVLFDDTFDHEVRNDTDEWRVVLFLDVLRELNGKWNERNKKMFKFLQNSKRAQKAAIKAETTIDSMDEKLSLTKQ